MDKISLTQEYTQNITILPNDFIDHHMGKADGEYVKIYLMILRFAGRGLPLSPDQLADALEQYKYTHNNEKRGRNHG